MRNPRPADAGPLPRQITLAFVATAMVALVPLLLVGAWSMLRIDERSLERERQLVEHAIDRAIAQVAYDQQSVSIWDDTVLRTRARDQAWMVENVGEWMHDYYGLDHTSVLTAQDEPVHTMLHGRTRPAAAFATLAPEVLPAVAELRRLLAGGADPLEASVTRVIAQGGTPVIVSVVPIVPSSERVTVAPAEAYVHVAVRLMDADFLAAIAESQMVGAIRYADVARGERPTMRPVPSKPWLGNLAWTEATPGRDLIARIAPVLGLTVAAFLALAVWLLVRLRRMATALHDSEARALERARHDALTGLPNRALFNEHLEAALARGACFALLYVDLDRFKYVNDTLGHPAGDELIFQVGQRFAQIVGSDGIVARLGGDEFAILGTTIRDSADAEALSGRIIAAAQQPFLLGEDTAFVDASVGIAIAPEAAVERSELLRKADIALYQAKGSGKGRSCLFVESLDALVRQKRTIEHDLRRALDDAVGLSLAYQPLFATDGETLIGAEALVRWDHPVHGPLSPATFVGVAEERGLIHRLGNWVLREACLTAKRLGLPWIAVNVSAAQMREPGFVGVVEELLRETDFPGERLQLEVTEGLLLDASEAVADALMQLRMAGIRIALDDFGTGYSSLQYLHRYRVDKIKIDRSFVSMLGSRQSDAIVRAMIQLGSALSLEVAAEGIETREQWHRLEAMGSPELQGYFFSRPMPASELEALLRDRADAGLRRRA